MVFMSCCYRLTASDATSTKRQGKRSRRRGSITAKRHNRREIAPPAHRGQSCAYRAYRLIRVHVTMVRAKIGRLLGQTIAQERKSRERSRFERR